MSEVPYTTEEEMFCYRHPDRATRLRCSRCEQPICAKCAILTPTGYRCPACVRSQQKIFDTAQNRDYPIAFFIAAVLSFLGSFVANFMGFLTLFVAPIGGVIIAEAVRWAVSRRRSKALFRVATMAAAIGSLPFFAINAVIMILSMSMIGPAAVVQFVPMLWQGLYTVLVSSTVYYRLGGIDLRSRY